MGTSLGALTTLEEPEKFAFIYEKATENTKQISVKKEKLS